MRTTVESAALAGAALAARFTVGLVFLTAALPKLAALGEFERAVRTYALLPLRTARPIALTLPGVEFVLGACLVSGLEVEPAALGATALLAAFSVAVTFNLFRGRKIDCGCRGAVSPKRIGWSLVAADLALTGAAVFAAITHPNVLVPAVGAGPVATARLGAGGGFAILLSVTCIALARGLLVAAARVHRTVSTVSEVRP